jgi:hypothetical protein
MQQLRGYSPAMMRGRHCHSPKMAFSSRTNGSGNRSDDLASQASHKNVHLLHAR